MGSNVLRSMQISPELLTFLRCPADTVHVLEIRSDHELFCLECDKAYPIVQNKVFFIESSSDVPLANVTPQDRWSRWRERNYNFFLRHLEPLSKRKVVCDLGAGPTNFRELLLQFDTYVGVDFRPFDLVSVVTDFTKTLPFRDDFCDIVFLSNVLEHIPYPVPLIREARRILRKGGMIIGATPFLSHVHQAPYDFNRYTNFMLELMFTESGFQNIEVTSLGTPFDVYEFAQRDFFNLLMESKFFDNLIGHRASKLFARLGRKISVSTTAVFKSVFRRVGASDVYTHGYGFKAVK